MGAQQMGETMDALLFCRCGAACGLLAALLPPGGVGARKALGGQPQSSSALPARLLFWRGGAVLCRFICAGSRCTACGSRSTTCRLRPSCQATNCSSSTAWARPAAQTHTRPRVPRIPGWHTRPESRADLADQAWLGPRLSCRGDRFGVIDTLATTRGRTAGQGLETVARALPPSPTTLPGQFIQQVARAVR